jgi:hypothetical protein
MAPLPAALRSIGGVPHRSLRHADHDPAVTAGRLASESRIICGGRAGGLRISLHTYNDSDDVDRLIGPGPSLAFAPRSRLRDRHRAASEIGCVRPQANRSW